MERTTEGTLERITGVSLRVDTVIKSVASSLCVLWWVRGKCQLGFLALWSETGALESEGGAPTVPVGHPPLTSFSISQRRIKLFYVIYHNPPLPCPYFHYALQSAVLADHKSLQLLLLIYFYSNFKPSRASHLS